MAVAFATNNGAQPHHQKYRNECTDQNCKLHLQVRTCVLRPQLIQPHEHGTKGVVVYLVVYAELAQLDTPAFNNSRHPLATHCTELHEVAPGAQRTQLRLRLIKCASGCG